jgi:vacuolar-type H+-ATPase subunit F/Vma7
MAGRKRVFISYAYESDRHYKNLLIAWDKNKQFDFFISDYSADVSINSHDATAIKRVISRYINEATIFLVIVGKDTHKSEWVRWEINKAVELGKKIVAVKTEQSNISPNELLNIGAKWAMSFTFAAIAEAMGSA